jgi:hypothetical protein
MNKIDWRASMWWRVGFSNGLSGEELANPAMLDELYRDDYTAGLLAGKEKRACQE